MHRSNSWPRRSLAAMAVVCLSVPSALGVYAALEPSRGVWAAGMAAAGLELVYVGTSILTLTPALVNYARRCALGAVIVAVMLNLVSDYNTKVPDGLSSWARFLGSFDPLLLSLALIESAPLAILAYSVTLLLHKISEVEPGEQLVERKVPPIWSILWKAERWQLWREHNAPVAPALRPQEIYPEPLMVADNDNHDAGSTSINAGSYACEQCGATLTRAQWMASRRWNGCKACRKVKR